MNPSNTWKGKLEVASILPSKSLDRQCAQYKKKRDENIWWIDTSVDLIKTEIDLEKQFKTRYDNNVVFWQEKVYIVPNF